MAAPEHPAPSFLRRWSQRKLSASREAPAAEAPGAAPLAPPAPSPPALEPAAAPSPPAADAEPKLPDVESLSFDSDFSAFLSPKVDEGTRRAALRKLFSDPRFNVMDGLDVYIDDYGKFEPVAPDVLVQLAHARYLFDPPKTRVNEHGHVEDVVDEPPAPAHADAAAPEPPPVAAPSDDLPRVPDAAAARVADGVPVTSDPSGGAVPPDDAPPAR